MEGTQGQAQRARHWGWALAREWVLAREREWEWKPGGREWIGPVRDGWARAFDSVNLRSAEGESAGAGQ